MKPIWAAVSGKGRGPNAGDKTIVSGMVQRDGHVKAEVVQNVKRKSLRPLIEKHVLPGSTVSTDELRSYGVLGTKGFNHGSVNHSKEQWVKGIHHTNNIENFWKYLKNGIRSTHIHVSRKYLQNYIEEFGFRYNNRKEPASMFYRMISHLAQRRSEAV